jgi:hypothetical protein
MTRPFRLDLTGRRFERWTVTGFGHKNSRGEMYWLCKCDCGTEQAVRANGLTGGRSTSCGCYHKEAVTLHGYTKSKTFKSWESMLQRCTNPTAPDYPKYGGRGIEVHPAWADSFEAFLADMGERPEGKTLDRINVNGNYTPDNCRWADLSTQQRNRRSTSTLTLNGVEKPLIEWAEEAGLTAKILSWRLRNGWTVEKALSTPPIEGRGKKRSAP